MNNQSGKKFGKTLHETSNSKGFYKSVNKLGKKLLKTY